MPNIANAQFKFSQFENNYGLLKKPQTKTSSSSNNKENSVTLNLDVLKNTPKQKKSNKKFTKEFQTFQEVELKKQSTYNFSTNIKKTVYAKPKPKQKQKTELKEKTEKSQKTQTAQTEPKDKDLEMAIKLSPLQNGSGSDLTLSFSEQEDLIKKELQEIEKQENEPIIKIKTPLAEKEKQEKQDIKEAKEIMEKAKKVIKETDKENITVEKQKTTEPLETEAEPEPKPETEQETKTDSNTASEMEKTAKISETTLEEKEPEEQTDYIYKTKLQYKNKDELPIEDLESVIKKVRDEFKNTKNAFINIKSYYNKNNIDSRTRNYHLSFRRMLIVRNKLVTAGIETPKMDEQNIADSEKANTLEIIITQ
jgi:hypothetical protein